MMSRANVEMIAYVNNRFLKCGFVINKICMEWHNTMVMQVRRKQRKYKLIVRRNYSQILPVDFAFDDCDACVIRHYLTVFKATAEELTTFYDNEIYQRELLFRTGIYVYNEQDINVLRVWTVNATI
jgi:hypothetical protein